MLSLCCCKTKQENSQPWPLPPKSLKIKTLLQGDKRMPLCILTLTTDISETLPAQSSPSPDPELSVSEGEKHLCQHCPCLEEKLLRTLFFRTLNNFPVTPSQKFLITHPAASDGLCLSALEHSLGRKPWQDRNWFMRGHIFSATGLVTGPWRRETQRGSTALEIGHWNLQIFIFEEGVWGSPSLNSALLVRELWPLVHAGLVTQAIPDTQQWPVTETCPLGWSHWC